MGGSLAKLLAKTSDLRTNPVVHQLIRPARVALAKTQAACLRANALRRGGFDPDQTVLISGSARAGTTWLAQILSAGPESCLVFEPLRSAGRHKQATGDWRHVLAADEHWPVGERFFRGLLDGSLVVDNSLAYSAVADLLRCRRLTIKCVGANTYIPWLARTFPGTRLVVIIRHPCAVVSSERKHRERLTGEPITAGGWDVFSASIMDRARTVFTDKGDYLGSLHSWEEILAANWAYQNHAVLAAEDPPWINVSYERLVMEGQREVERLFAELGLEPGDGWLSAYHRSSLTTWNYSVDHQRSSAEERLSNWKKHLDPGQVSQVLGVLKELGVGGYSEEILPDQGW
jgi:hypothetical protein